MTKHDAGNETTQANPATRSTPPPLKQPPTSAWAGIAVLVGGWLREEGPWWLCSFVFHIVLVCSLALIGTTAMVTVVGDAPSFNEVQVESAAEKPKDIERFELGDVPEDPTVLNTETLMIEKPGQIAQEEKYYDDNPVFSEAGGGTPLAGNQPNLGGMGFDLKALGPGPALRGKGGVGVGIGEGTNFGIGGDAMGFGGRGAGSRKARLGTGATPLSERAVAGALNWLARHQSSDGSWSLTSYNARCKDATCSGPAVYGYDIAGTAFGLLPFLAAGQTHDSKGPYKQAIGTGVRYLIGRQKSDGSFSGGQTLYEHGLAAIALCECFGMTRDQRVGRAAQAALDYIADAQDPSGGGWRYQPRTPGDTSVTGWQVMALKSGQMASLSVNPMVLAKAKKFLESVSSGGPDGSASGGRFGYTSSNDPTPTRSAVGLLCYQYLGVPRSDPAMISGTAYLMQNPPEPAPHDAKNLLDAGDVPGIYYWYYATQVMHNQIGPDWDIWNRKMRRLLINAQCREGCATGSWDPKLDYYGAKGGRLMQTSLSALTLEVYYRYLPLYKLDQESGAAR